MLDGSFGYDLSGQTARKVKNKRESFTYEYAVRLQKVEIECTDALRIIRSRDSKDSFFYCDPPYIGTDCGHYDGYTVEDYQMLLDLLSQIEGKFLLSSFPSEVLAKAAKTHGWMQKEIHMAMSVNAKLANRNKATKIEVLTGNYDLNMGQQELF